MSENFIKNEINLKDLIKQEPTAKSYYLYENNFKQINEIQDFLKDKTKILLVSGFLGTGKGEILNKVLSYTNNDTLTLEYTCFETTILDDILLSFFDNFKKLIALNLIESPKIKSENFIQKIMSYFQSIKKPIIIRINSCQEILKNNKDEILNFLFHLSNFENIKIILSSRRFDTTLYENKVSYKKVSIIAFDKNIFEKYLKSEGIKIIGPISDELYKYTKGYYLYTNLAIKIIKLRNLQLIDFLSGYTKSMLSFNDFIFREGLSLVDPISGHLFRLLTIIRHPISINLLATLNLYDENKINYFIDNLILHRIGNLIYLPEHYKIIAQNAITENIAIKIHKSCSQLYETQLPLKPLERDMLLSRATMRKEIEYHNSFIPQRPKFVREPLTGIQFAEYPKKNIAEPKPKLTHQETLENSKEAIKKVSFIFDENALDNIADTINTFVESSHENAVTEEEIRNLTIAQLINLAKKTENDFNYKKVIAIYQKALTLNTDEDFEKFLSTIYTKLAENYKKLSDWFSAKKYYELAIEIFESTGDLIKSNEIKYELANIYYMTFKHDEALSVIQDILNTKSTSNNLYLKTLILLINIKETQKENCENIYKQAIEFSTSSNINSEILSELYYKYAVSNDSNGILDNAIIYYKKCISLGSETNKNPYLSSAYSNISAICEDAEQHELAIKYALESLKIDEKATNYNGIYTSSIRLAQLYQKSDYDKAVYYYKKAHDSAIKLNEPFYIASVNLAIGDLVVKHKKFDVALKHYYEALKIAKVNFKPDNIKKIEIRINDLKLKLGDDFEKYRNNIIKH